VYKFAKILFFSSKPRGTRNSGHKNREKKQKISKNCLTSPKIVIFYGQVEKIGVFWKKMD